MIIQSVCCNLGLDSRSPLKGALLKIKIDLATLPELNSKVGIRIIRTKEQFQDFLGNLRQDYYSPERLKNRDFEATFERWIDRRKPFTEMFYVVENEEDDHVRNDDWGNYKLFRAIAIRVANDEVYVLMSLIETFVH